jgi:hypothetical protein
LDARLEEEVTIMAQYRAPARPLDLGIFSMIFGLLGLALCWWTPTGMILSVAGMTIGLVGCIMSRRGDRTPPAAGLIFSTASLAVCWIVAAWGLELIRMTALQ